MFIDNLIDAIQVSRLLRSKFNISKFRYEQKYTLPKKIMKEGRGYHIVLQLVKVIMFGTYFVVISFIPL